MIMKINLLPKEKQSQSPINFNSNRVGIVAGMTIIVFGLCFYLGYLYYTITAHEARLKQLNIETKYYSTQYQKVKNMEIALNRLRDKNSLKQAVYASYLVPLNVLTTLIQSKPDLIWFEGIEFNGIGGSFILTGGATNYQALTGFIGQLEQDKAAFAQLKPEQATIYDNSAGREYIKFKISGTLAKRSETSGQNN
jgi:hypothetical protein